MSDLVEKFPRRFISVSHVERLQRIRELVEWIQTEKPKILKWLNREGRMRDHMRDFGFSQYAPKFWFRDEKGVNRHVYFKDLPKETKEIIFARYIRRALKFRIAMTWNFCSATVKNYVTSVMNQIGCRYYKNRWRCSI